MTQRPAAVHSLGRPGVVWPGDVVLADFPLKEQILVVRAQQPWASAGDISRRLESSFSDIRKASRDLEDEGLIAGLDVGVTRRRQRRSILTRNGVFHVVNDFHYRGLTRPALPLTWQLGEEGVSRILAWPPMFESTYEVLPTFWTSGIVFPFRLESRFADPACTSRVWLGEPTLVDLLWLPSGRLHVVTIWRFDRVDGPSRYLSIPLFWSGLLPQEGYRNRSLRLGSRYIRSERRPGDRILWQVEPTAVALGEDEFAAFRAKTAYGDDVQVGAVDTAGNLVWSAEASHSEWTHGDQPPQARSIGHPEAAAIDEGPDLVNLGIREYRIFHFLSQFRAATKRTLVTAFHMSRGAVNSVIEHLTERGLVTSVGPHLYLTCKAVDMLAALHRVDAGRLVEVTYLDPEGEEAAKERRHDSAVATVAAKFLGAGILAVAGWRWVVDFDGGQLVPDLWVQLPVPGGDGAIWVPVEVEFSAKGEKRIKRKLRSYRLAPVRLGASFPLLVITGEILVAQRFDEWANYLPMLTTTLEGFLTGVWEGSDSVWRSGGRPVGLIDFAKERRAHLWQPTVKSLDYSKPSSEVWDRYLREESIWSDPQGEGLYGALFPIDPQLQKEMDRALNAPEAESAPNENESGSAPPTPPSAPDRRTNRAEERARRQRELLSEIHLLMPIADDVAASKLRTEGLSDVERLCVIRVRTIIRYGASLHNRDEDGHMEELLKRCITVREDHLGVMKSRGLLWRFTVPEHEVHPGEQFKHLLGFYNRRHGKDDARKAFEQWHRAVEAAARAARRARTVE